MSQPWITIAVDSYVGAFLAIGFLIPMSIAALAGGYLLAHIVRQEFSKTILGSRIRRWFTRKAPSKFFPEDMPDRVFVEKVIIEALERNAPFRDRVRELSR